MRVVEADLDADVGLRMDAGGYTPLSQGALRINYTKHWYDTI